MFALGAAHLLITFRGPKLKPRDPDLIDRLRSTSPGISGQTTMWRAWLGFNASHSVGAMLFGSIYGYLAVVERNLLFETMPSGTGGRGRCPSSTTKRLDDSLDASSPPRLKRVRSAHTLPISWPAYRCANQISAASTTSRPMKIDTPS